MLRLIPALTITGTLTLAASAPVLFQGMEMPQPTEEHAMIQKGVGEWEGTVTMYVPGMPEAPVPATETVRSGGPFWTISDFHSDFMGAPYRGHGCHGFDPTKGKYVGTWIDNLSSYLSVMEGEYDAESKTIVMHWDAPDMTGTIVPHRAEQVFEDDAYKMTFFANGTKHMVIEMQRKGTAAIEAAAEAR